MRHKRRERFACLHKTVHVHVHVKKKKKNKKKSVREVDVTTAFH